MYSLHHRYTGKGEWQKATEMLKTMKDDGVEPDMISYSTVLAAVRRAFLDDNAIYFATAWV